MAGLESQGSHLSGSEMISLHTVPPALSHQSPKSISIEEDQKHGKVEEI